MKSTTVPVQANYMSSELLYLRNQRDGNVWIMSKRKIQGTMEKDLRCDNFLAWSHKQILFAPEIRFPACLDFSRARLCACMAA